MTDVHATIPPQLQEIDKKIVAAAQGIKVLSRLSWPNGVRDDFLSAWGKGKPYLPEVSYTIPESVDQNARTLENAMRDLRAFSGPLATYVFNTAESYYELCLLLKAAGTSDITKFSRRLYGAPGDIYADGKLDSLDAAHHFLNVSKQYSTQAHLAESEYCLSAQTLKAELAHRMAEVFPPGLIEIKVDKKIAAKATAGATVVKLRAATCFTEYDLEQLLQHEVFIHSLTALNGRAQANLQSLSLGAPRTTSAQEGLATFSELVTGAIDVDRLERIALRVIAIDKAIAGANFIEVFEFFLEAGQPENESFNSTMRVFRGAPTSGGSAFTKDVVYLHGLVEVYSFFSWAMRHQRLQLCRNFLAGRMTIGDAITLEPMFTEGILLQPRFLPPWMTKVGALAGHLAFSIFANQIEMENITEERWR